MDPLELYTPATLTHSINRILPENLYLSKILGKGVSVKSPTETAMFDVEHGRRDLAPMGNNGDPATKVDFAETYKTFTVTPPQIFLEDTIKASDVAKLRMAGQSPIILGSGNSDGVVAAFNDMIAKKQKNLKRSISRRIEWMYSQALSTGGIDYTCDSSGRSFSVDFGVPDGNKFTVSEKWDASSSAGDPLTQFPQFQRTFATQNGVNPTVIIAGTAAADAFRSNSNVKSWLKSAGVQLLQINQGIKEDLVTPVAQIPGVGTMVEYAASYPADGVTPASPYIPEDCVILTHPSLWEMHYGAVSDFDLGENPLAMVELYSKIKVSPDGKTKSLYVESHPLPVLTCDTGIMVVKVCG